MPELYDLIFIGIDAKVTDRTASVNSIAKFLEIDVAKIEDIVVNDHKAIVKRGLQLHDAQQCQKQIFRHGGFCNYRLSSKGRSEFELIPIEEKIEDIVFICPACDYHEKVASIQQLPVTCPKCGIIPGKYQKATELKAEREMMKKRLLNNQRLLEEQAKELAEGKEKAARRKKLEEQLRKELGLPGLLNSRPRVFTSVVLVWILGIGIGILGVNNLQTGSQVAEKHLPLTAGHDACKNNWALSPQQQTLRQLITSSQLDDFSMETELSLMSDSVDQIVRGGTNPFLVGQAASILAKISVQNPSATFTADSQQSMGDTTEISKADKVLERFLAGDTTSPSFKGQPEPALADAKTAGTSHPHPSGKGRVRAKAPAEITNSPGLADSLTLAPTGSPPLASPTTTEPGSNSTALSTNAPPAAAQSAAVQTVGNYAPLASQATAGSGSNSTTLPTNAPPVAAQSVRFQANDSPVSPVKAQLTQELNGKALLLEMHLDREWALFLAAEAERQARQKQPLKALQKVDAISLDELKLTTIGKLDGYYLASNDKAESERVYDLAMARINAFTDVSKQADSLGRWSASLWKIDEKAKSQQNLEAAIKLVATIANPAEKAKGEASLGKYQAQESQLKQAQSNFQRANQLVQSIDDPATQLRTYIHLASCYAQTGGKDVATTILVKILDNVSRINDETLKSDLLGEIAIAFADMGEAGYALVTVNKLDSQQKEQMLFNVTRELAYTNRPIDALKGLDKLISPVNRSRAAALMSLVFHYHPGLNALSSSLQEKANESQAQITSLPSQAVVRGEMSRYLAHAGLNKEAEDWAVKALESARKINNAQDRDIAFALLAVNFARAWQFDLATDSIAKIKDYEIADVATKEITGINQLFSGQ